MCGRFTRHMTWKQLVYLSRLSTPTPTTNLQPHLNICPTDPILIIRDRRGEREIAEVRWGLVPPSFDEAMMKKFQNHNARSDKIGVTGWWTKPFKEGRRCLIPASGFYEWRDEGKGKKKTRFYITKKSGEPMTMAGLWVR
jgi:putative SOS response-associated peptidase YedK